MKRIALMTLFAIILNIAFCPATFAGVPFAEANEAGGHAEALLGDLGIIEPGFMSDEQITRGEFCALMCRALSIDGAYGTDVPYTDVDASHKYVSDIKSMYEWGIISYAAEFRPDDYITSAEAAKMAVVTAGYDFLALSKGGWPYGYVAAASELELDVPAVMTKSAAAELIYDMMHTKLPTASILNSHFQYYPHKGETILRKIWGLEFLSGEVTDGQFFGFTMPDGAGYGNVVIGGYLFSKGSFDTDSLVGENADVYYNSKFTLCSVYKDDNLSENTQTVYSTQDIIYKDNVYSYLDLKDRTEKTEISKTALIVRNGKRAAFDAQNAVPGNGYIRFIKDSGGKAKAVIIKDYEEILVNAVDYEDELVSDGIRPGYSRSLKADNIILLNQNGEEALLSDISEGDVLWLAASGDGELLEVIICKDIIIGEYTGKSADGELVYIDNGEYMISDSASESLEKDFVMGDVLTGHINPCGEIVAFEKSEGITDENVGYLIESALTGKGMSKEISVRILSPEEEIKEFNFAARFNINSVTFKGEAEKIYESLAKQIENPSSMPQGIVLYRTDSEGKINSMSYADDMASAFGGKNTGMYKSGELDGYSDNYVEYKRTGSWITGKNPGRIFVKSATVVFVVPAEEDIALAIDDDYRTEKVSSYAITEDISKKHLTGYSLDMESGVSDYVVARYRLASSSQSVSTTSTMYMVEKVNHALSSDGSTQAVLSVRSASNTLSKFYSDDLDYFKNLNLKFGDVVKVSADSRCNVRGVLVMYRRGEKSFANQSTFASNGYTMQKSGSALTNNSGMESVAGSFVFLGNVYSRTPVSMDLLQISTEPENYTGEAFYPYTLKDIKFILCDVENETITPGKASDIKSYEDFGDKCSIAVVETRSGHISSMFVYEEP